MHRFIASLLLLNCLPLFAFSQSAHQHNHAKIVKLGEFEDSIRVQRGKVVIVYFWASYNPPAIQQYLHFDKLRAKLPSNGISAFSACLDPEIDSDRKKNIDNLLVRLKASCPCFLPAEGSYFWEEKLKISTNPAVMIVDQAGRRTIFDLSEDDTNLMQRTERLVEKLLSAKK